MFKYVIILLTLCISHILCADEMQALPQKSTAKISESLILEAQVAMERGVNFLLSKQDSAGAWCEDPAITALCMLALNQKQTQHNRSRINSAIEKGRKYCLSFQQADGAFAKDGKYINYTTSVVLSTLAILNHPDDREAMVKARHFLIDSQLDEDHATSPTPDSSPFFGGIGYGKAGLERPDLSNTQFALEALALSAHLEGEDHPVWEKKSNLAWKNALVFLARCQQISDTALQTQNITDLDIVNDGGFIYKPDESKAKSLDSAQNLRSYGSMTYAGIKSMIYARLTPDDFRVKAARAWAEKHYTLNENPGMGGEGHLYYLHTFAKTNAVLGDETLKDAQGNTHYWREELIRKLLNMEQNGIWINPVGRWMESIPELTTAYAMISLALALQYENNQP